MRVEWIRWGVALFFALLAGSTPAVAGQVELVSRVAPGLESETAAGFSTVGSCGLSADGRYFAFANTAPNLVQGQVEAPFHSNVFLFDRVTGSLTLVSHAAGLPDTPANAESSDPCLSADGRTIAFDSDATNLVPGQDDQNSDLGGGDDVFLFDRISGTTTLVSHSATSVTTAGATLSFGQRISADGRYVAFVSASNNFVPGQVEGNSSFDVFLFDRDSGAITLVSRNAASPTTTANELSFVKGLSGDGRYVVFTTAARDVVAGQSDPGFTNDVFLFDRVAGTNVLVSPAAGSTTATGNGDSGAAEISADGAWIAFISDATNLATGLADSNSTSDLFVYDRAAGTNTLVSHASGSATTTANAITYPARVSPDGAWITFLSAATNLVSGQSDANGGFDVFLYERASGTVTLVSHGAASPTATGSARSIDMSLSADGAQVAFISSAADLVPGQVDAGSADVFLFDRASGAVSLVSHTAGSSTRTGNLWSGASDQPTTQLPTYALSLSADGAYLTYVSLASDLVSGDANGREDAFLYSRTAGANMLASRHAPSQASATSLVGVLDTGFGDDPGRILPSADGRFVAYFSTAGELSSSQVDANADQDIFLFDRLAATSVLVSHATGLTTMAGNGRSILPAMSADGRFITFLSLAGNLVPGQAGPTFNNAFLFDRFTGTTVLVSHSQTAAATTANADSGVVSISGDGRRVFFLSKATDLVAGPAPCCGGFHLYSFDRSSGVVSRVSHANGSTAPADGSVTGPALSSWDGRFTAFLSNSSNLVSGQLPGSEGQGLYLADLTAGSTVLVSRERAFPSAPSLGAMSTDGRFVAFNSLARDLVPGQDDRNAGDDVFLFDRLTGTIRLLSGSGGSSTITGDDDSSCHAISADGRFVAFSSKASDLISGVTGSPFGIYLFDRIASTLTLVSHASGSPTTPANGGSFNASISDDGSTIAFGSDATDLVEGQAQTAGPKAGVFLYDRLTGRTELASRSLTSPTTIGNGNSGSAQVSADGQHVVFSSVAGDLVAKDFNQEDDVFLYSRDLSPGLSFFTLTPCRQLDTRQAGQGPALASGARRTLAVAGGACGVPVTAKAVAVNLTITQATGLGHLTVSPGDFIASPTSSTINFSSGQTRANNAILPLASGGAGTLIVDPAITAGGTVHLILDVTGYFE